ncbi:MAG TPA: hypothetical protein DD458_06800 [Prolixibacteraceae bacterium]|nr:hypothetical protein [Marinilabiliales bacterium]HBL74922.1 hypothetical protein [Prolixibacteraceae bacterium]HCU62329.1 hypothetical protein [Prolixibacteraceae bacterium]
MTSSYHFVSLSNFELFADICQRKNIALPENYIKTLESMWNYLSVTMRPSGYGIQNNDADLSYNRDLNNSLTR